MTCPARITIFRAPPVPQMRGEKGADGHAARRVRAGRPDEMMGSRPGSSRRPPAGPVRALSSAGGRATVAGPYEEARVAGKKKAAAKKGNFGGKRAAPFGTKARAAGKKSKGKGGRKK